jgi:ubiquinone/menaquinone biosynthesis C-methylase UbiE
MSMQNIYDDEKFFEEYKRLRENSEGFNDVIEQPAIKSLISELNNKDVLDVGCGFGDFCRYAKSSGANRIVGLEPSQKMLEEAKKKTHLGEIEYLHTAVECFEFEPNSFDVVVSSLAFHYIEDVDLLFNKIHQCLKPNGQLVFSVEHPICTAHPDATLGADEKGKFHPVYNYRDEGSFKQFWFVEGVEKYHRKISTYINALLDNGFSVEKVLEPMPTDEQIAQNPHFEIHKIRPPLLLVSVFL